MPADPTIEELEAAHRAKREQIAPLQAELTEITRQLAVKRAEQRAARTLERMSPTDRAALLRQLQQD